MDSMINSDSNHVHFAPSEHSSSQQTDLNHSHLSNHPDRNGNGDRDELNEEEQDLFLLAKSYFDSHQLERCSALLESMNSDSTKVTFLRLYSRFLVSEEKKI